MNKHHDLSLTPHDSIRSGYSDIAKTGVWLGAQFDPPDEEACGSGGSCCGGLTLSVEELAQKIGYDKAAIEALPEGTNMGLSCGPPPAIAALEEGDVVLDLGSGGGQVRVRGYPGGVGGSAI